MRLFCLFRGNCGTLLIFKAFSNCRLFINFLENSIDEIRRFRKWMPEKTVD